MQSLRDNSDFVKKPMICFWMKRIKELLFNQHLIQIKFQISQRVATQIAIFREQGINGQNEMAYAFDKAGFKSVDVHMTDLLEGRFQLNEFQALVACGGSLMEMFLVLVAGGQNASFIMLQLKNS